MQRSGLTGSLLFALIIAVGCGAALALPIAGTGGESVGPVLQRVSHQPKQWNWRAGWWRYGPWADHTIQGMVITRPGLRAGFFPWGAERLRYCAATYRSFDPATGTYLTSGGERRICR